MPKISVIIPTYNSAAFLPMAIESVLSQSNTNFEIIVIDDGSTDRTAEALSSYGSQIHSYYQENRGVGSARNKGIKIAKGDYYVFLDADDLFLNNKLEIQSAYLDQHPEIDVVYSNGYLLQQYGKEALVSFSSVGLFNKNLSIPEMSLPILTIQNGFPIHAAMARASCINHVGGFDEDRVLMPLADWDLWYRLAENYRFAYLDGFVANYRILENSLSRNNANMKAASRILERKIERSKSFHSLANSVQSEFYFKWGVVWLEYGETANAIQHFSQALKWNSRHILARMALIFTKIMGKKAVLFPNLKHRLLDPRRFN